MRKERTLILLGLWIIILPFLGFPSGVRTTLIVITGLFVLYLAYLYYLENRERLSKIDNHSKTFIDNVNQREENVIQ